MKAGVAATLPCPLVATHVGDASETSEETMNAVALASSVTHAFAFKKVVVDASHSFDVPTETVPTHVHLLLGLHAQQSSATPVASAGAYAENPVGHCGFALVGNAATGDHPSGMPASAHVATKSHAASVETSAHGSPHVSDESTLQARNTAAQKAATTPAKRT